MEEWAIASFRDEYRFLSNFYPSPLVFSNVVFPTVEHAYQAGKSLDPEHRKRILADPSPGAAKRLGQEANLRDDWDDVKYQLMHYLVTLKFKDQSLRKRLLMTGNHPLVEGNHWHDMYWGMCTCAKHATLGQNNLGKILMSVREFYAKVSP